ncbi:glycosyltransferase family 87 protein [Saccharomonospora cyanea]|uniref:Putative integral membrane protein n=1 Tax=Saccharomonospora cyanea NA-134 TaxID=882082 RepID=H5XRJ6_9PSEU|nr:glycosyltransferase 87 family protein [Saccharomonospora cyanea]EHR63941.1 putative integral membrane protein [Saccharomonospora cyanea NA-134]
MSSDIHGPPSAPTPDTASLDATQREVPSWSDPLAQAATRPLGGPLGTHAAVGRHWFWTPLRVCLLLAVLALTAGWFGKAACIQQYVTDDGDAELDWRSGRQYVAMCYSDIVPLYTAERLDEPDSFPYATSWVENEGTEHEQVRYMEYPVLSGLFQWVNAKLTHGWTAAAESGWLPGALPVAVYFNITAFFLSAAWLVTVWAVARTARRRVWDAAIVAVSPLVVVHAFTNFDALATAAAATGLLAWSRRKPVLAGVLLGVGAAAKLYPLFFLGPLLVLCLRAGKMKAWGSTAGTAVLTWGVINLPFMLFLREGWSEFFRLNTQRDMDPDSLYNVVSYFTGWQGFDGPLAPGEAPTVLNTVSGALFLALCAGIAYVGLSAPRRPRVAQLCFLVVAAFLLTNKVWSPQYSLWLVPLAVLALPRWRLLLGWMVVDALVWAPRMFYYLGTGNKGLPEGWFLGTVVVRDIVVVLLCVLVLREIYRPSRDLVRVAGTDDPTGGVLDGAEDSVVLRPRRRQGGERPERGDHSLARRNSMSAA